MLYSIYFINVISLLFIFLNNPISLVILIMLTSLLFCVMIMLVHSTSWFAFILFLIFLGGLMVLFIYMCSIASNETISMKINKILVGLTLIFSFFITLSIEFNKMIDLNSFIFLNKMFFSMNKMILSFTIIYLLFTLFVCVLISKSKYGPIRMKKN